MSLATQLNRIERSAGGCKLLPALVDIALSAKDRTEFFNQAVEKIHSADAADTTAIVRGIKGTWRTIAQNGSGSSKESKMPIELFAEVLDSDQPSSASGWIACPIESPNSSGRLLVQKSAAKSTDEIESCSAALAIALNTFSERQQPRQRAERLHAMLDMTARWNQNRETDQLLVEIAEASTRLLDAERATIFLPDASGQMLIGKPALGVESGQLSIPADAGVVGKVMSSGEPQRVDTDIADEQKQINREVDEQLNFETRSLLCVPLVNSKGKTIGAFELINKINGNFSNDDQAALLELAAHSAVAIENTQHVEKLVTTKKVVADQAAGQVQLIGNCPEIEKLKATVERVADTDLAILITGENGTGKEVVAQLIHYLSSRRDNALVAVNCAAITESLLESELFGHEKGAFTDAHQARAGKFEVADQGTLFLDEIGDMTLGGQAKMLRVLEEKIVVRVGGSTPIPTEARILAATNQNLPQLVQEKKFREDLFFRLNVVTIELPPLRVRGEDIILLAEHFLDGFCKKARRNTPKMSAAARKRLLQHEWPGNVRELRNMMERLAYLSSGDKVEPDDLAFLNASTKAESTVPTDLKLNEATKLFQRDYIQQSIDRCAGNMTDAAARLGLHRSNLYRKMGQLGMKDGDESEGAE